jgi:hypothetical protein
MPLIWARCEAIYFRQSIWTTQIRLKWLVKLAFARSGGQQHPPMARSTHWAQPRALPRADPKKRSDGFDASFEDRENEIRAESDRERQDDQGKVGRA